MTERSCARGRKQAIGPATPVGARTQAASRDDPTSDRRRARGALPALALVALLAGQPSGAAAQESAGRAEAIQAFGQMDLERAERLARAWLADHPDDTEITRLLGMVLVTAGMELERQQRPREEYLAPYRESLEILLEAERLGGGRPQPSLNHAVGFLLLSQGRPEQAEARLSRAIEEAPDNFVLYRLRGSARGELGRYQEAESDLRRAVALDGDDMASRLFLAHVLQLQGRNRDAAEGLVDYYARIEEQPADERHFRTLYEIAGYRLLLNDVESARDPLERACRLQPANPVCHNELGKLYHRLEEFELAVPELDAVIADPEAPRDVRRQALHYRGLIANDTGDYAGASGLFERALELSPNQAETLKAQAAALRKLGRRERAREVLDRLRGVVEIDNEITRLRSRLRSSPRDREARLELARLLIRLDRNDEARQEIAALERGRPGDPDVAELARKLTPDPRP